MGNSQSNRTTTGETKHDHSTGEVVVNFDLFSDQNSQLGATTEKQIESSQVDHFSSDDRVEELKTILGEDFVNNQKKHYHDVEEVINECSKLMIAARNNPNIPEENVETYLLACLMRKSEKFSKHSKPFRCLEDEYMDEMLNIDVLFKHPPNILQEKFKDFHEDFMYCCSQEDSNEQTKIMETMSLEFIFREPYSAILSTPLQVELVKSRYLPNRTIVEGDEIEHQLMEPFIYNPKTDTEKDFEQKLEALSQTPFLKNDIELVKECYQNREQNPTCWQLFLGISYASEMILCKKDILMNSPLLTFPNVEDAPLLDFNKNTPCNTLFNKHFEKLFPDMADFKQYLDPIENAVPSQKQLFARFKKDN